MGLDQGKDALLTECCEGQVSMNVEAGWRFEDMENLNEVRKVVVVSVNGVTVTIRNEKTGKETKANVGSFWPETAKKRSKGFRRILS